MKKFLKVWLFYTRRGGQVAYVLTVVWFMLAAMAFGVWPLWRLFISTVGDYLPFPQAWDQYGPLVLILLMGLPILGFLLPQMYFNTGITSDSIEESEAVKNKEAANTPATADPSPDSQESAVH